MGLQITVGKRSGERVVLESIHTVLALFCLIVACVELCDAAAVVDVYRIIQYDLGGVPFGSRRASLNHHAGSMIFTPGTDLSRTVVIMPIREVNLTFLHDYLVNKRLLGGLLLLLPKKSVDVTVEDSETDDAEELDGSAKSRFAELEQWLIHNNIPYPVYFSFEEEKLNAILDDIKQNDATGQPATATTGGYKLVLPVLEPRKLASPSLTNIQGWLPGLRGDGDSTQLPTIAIVASYDTFGAAPALSVGSDSNGSGVVVLLELARLFSRLYANAKTRGRYNLMFGLTAGGPYNYNGTYKWLRSFDQRLRESIDYAICLNSIGSWNNELWLHVSKPPENVYIKQIFDGISDVAEELGITVGVKHKKINISNPRVAWEHEQFSRHRVTAVTLSELSSAPELLEHTGGLYDSRDNVNDTAVIKSVKLVAESLARHIYGHQGRKIEIFADGSSLAVNPSYMRLWLDLLSRTPRVAPFLTKTDPIITALKKELSDHTMEVSVQHEFLDGMFTFYDLTHAKLSIYQVASVTFDLVILLVVATYLSVLFIFLVVTTRGLDDLISIFRRPPSRKAKAA
eukprot:Gb_13304 [translate_table: standard]